MKTKVKELIREYRDIIGTLYSEGYIIEHKDFSEKCIGSEKYELTWYGRNSDANITFDLSLDANYIVDNLLESEQFSILFYDKSILQVEYCINNNIIIKQRLQYIKKSSNIMPKEKVIELEGEISEVEGSDWFEIETGIPIFLRVDYDPQNHIDLIHSKSHFVFSNIKDCRIPMKSNVTLTQFITLILEQIYNDYEVKFNNKYKYDDEITRSEQEGIHFNWT